MQNDSKKRPQKQIRLKNFSFFILFFLITSPLFAQHKASVDYVNQPDTHISESDSSSDSSVFLSDSIASDSLNPLFDSLSFKEPVKISDSSKTIEKPSRRKIYFGLQLGVQFTDFTQADLFAEDLNAYIQQKYSRDSSHATNNYVKDSVSYKSNSSKVLQPFDNVIWSLPFGAFIGIPVTRYLDICLSTQFFTKEQEAIIETVSPDITYYEKPDSNQAAIAVNTVSGTIRNISRTYTTFANLGGIGLKFYIPKQVLSVKGDKTLYFSYTHLWNIGGTQFWSSAGSEMVPYSLFGTGYELSLGFLLNNWKYIGVNGNISLVHLNFPVRGDWTDILLQDEIEGNYELEFNALKFNFQLVYQFGGYPEAKKPAHKQKGKTNQQPLPYKNE
ncbi:MAG: hypothetical protein HQK83_16895 [Fibrobacteria bacterium]|nr:hypothetical protein [Fibrobacteria bacterium]